MVKVDRAGVTPTESGYVPPHALFYLAEDFIQGFDFL